MTQKPWAMVALSTLLLATPAAGMEKLGRISPNPFLGDGTANPFSMYNNRFNPNSPRNHFGPYGNRFSPYSGMNRFSVDAPRVYGGPFEDSDPYVDNYLSQEMDAAEITGAMEIVWRGGAYIPPLPNPAPQLVAEDGSRVVDDPRLTARQRDVLALMRMGKSNKEIARDLDIAESTVKVHVAAIFQILHVRNRLSAIIRSQPRIANGPAINLSA